jgi:predicted Zn-dependent peptidase
VGNDNNQFEKDQFEKELAETLQAGDMHKDDPASKAQELLPPKYEIRIPAQKDPIIEETRMIREMAKEVDDRYDDYLSREPKK